jgi:hypothetical protein
MTMAGEENHSHRWARSWAITREHLARAKSMLVAANALPENEEVFATYNEFLDHNELELGFDELESIGDEAHADAPFWAELAQAAENMGLTQHAARCRQRVQE